LSNRGAYLYVALSDSTEIDSEFEFTVDLPPEVKIWQRGTTGENGSASESMRL